MIKNKIHIYRAIIILIGIFAIGPLWSQQSKVQNLITFDEEPYHFGFLLGVNQILFTINSNDKSLGAKPLLGFTVGVVSDLRLGKFFNLRFIPNLQFGARRLLHPTINYYDAKSVLLNFPLDLKIKGMRMHNARPYILIGGSLSIDVGDNAEYATSVNTGDFLLDPIDFYANTGVGFDFYFNWFKMSAEIKMSYGINNNIFIQPGTGHPWANSINSLKSKVFQFNITIE